MSVQASETHHCQPRNDVGPYLSCEVGFPSEYTPEFAEYSEGDPEDMTGGVCGWVPLEVVEAVIARHGGLSVRAMLNYRRNILPRY